jgi:uncharacterized protein
MLTTIAEFRHRVDSDRSGLIADLQARTGRYGADEAHAWESSLPKLSRIFQAASFQPLHLYFGSRGNLALEYQLPAASSWCDVVLLGAYGDRPSAVIVELKDWMTRGDAPGRFEGLVERQGRQDLHPSDQVRGYTAYCRRFHSAVADRNAAVHGCVLFTRDRWAKAYSEPPNDRLAAEYPLFTDAPDDVHRNFPAYFETRLTAADESFAVAFSEGHYRQNRGFVAQIGAQILDPKAEIFELLDNQRRAFAVCRGIIADSFETSTSADPPKKVVIIKGPPGSGKSVIAARLWASLVTNPAFPEGDVVFTTTSMSQNSNWSDLFDRTAGVPGAGGIVRKATSYAPITTQRLGQLRKQYGARFLEDADDWRDHVRTLRALGEPFRDGARDNQNLVSIVDEAHALINTEDPTGRGQFGFVTSVGPQAYHIIRSSLLSVFLLDPLQGFRQRENTSIDDIREWCREAGAGDPEEISLEGSQFRCAGSVEYVEWVEAVLGGVDEDICATLAASWRHRNDTPAMDFRIFEEPETWEECLRRRNSEGNSARLLSTYSRKWKTQKVAAPHSLPTGMQDFGEQYRQGSEHRVWSRIWNYAPNDDYTWFVAGVPGSYIAEDPLCEVGCPYAVRGFDFDYVGILWLDDLVWRGNAWRVNPDAVEETGIRDLTLRARREIRDEGPAHATAELLDRVVQAYRILFTRALKGVYVWVPDDETRRHLMLASESRDLTSRPMRT